MIDEQIAYEVVEKLEKKSMTIAAAESCTGGLVAATIVGVPGASNVLNESYVTYSNEAKHRLLGVKEETLQKYGAVSEQTACEMAEGIAKAAHADVGVSTTGLAGPGGGTEEKPVGLVYIGCCVNGNIEVSKCVFQGDRQQVREQAVMKVLHMLNDRIL